MKRAAVVTAIVLLGAGCGYRSAAPGADPDGPFVVVAGGGGTPRADLVAPALAGARMALARAGELGACAPAAPGGCAVVELELLRVDEAPAAIAGPPGPSAPSATAVRVSITARAVVRRGAAPVRATGDVTVSEVVAREAAPMATGVAAATAGERAAHRLGERLGRAVLGFAEPADD